MVSSVIVYPNLICQTQSRRPPTPSTSCAVYTVRLYTVRLYTVRLYTVRLYTVRLYTVRLYTVRLYTVRLYTVRLYIHFSECPRHCDLLSSYSLAGVYKVCLNKPVTA